LQFFAHHSDECATSPESLWHLTAKNLIVRELDNMGVHALLERPVKGVSGALKSDIYFETNGRNVAIEIQHSYQTYAEYLRRQEKYASCGIDNYCLLFQPRYKTITISIAKHQIRDKYGGQFPKDRPVGSVPELPLSVFDTANDLYRVRGPGGLNVPLASWLASLIRGSFRYKDDLWRIVDDPELEA
jgi:hypothetical protein